MPNTKYIPLRKVSKCVDNIYDRVRALSESGMTTGQIYRETGIPTSMLYTLRSGTYLPNTIEADFSTEIENIESRIRTLLRTFTIEEIAAASKLTTRWLHRAGSGYAIIKTRDRLMEVTKFLDKGEAVLKTVEDPDAPRQVGCFKYNGDTAVCKCGERWKPTALDLKYPRKCWHLLRNDPRSRERNGWPHHNYDKGDYNNG